jgi:hypothetical protein
MRCRMNVIIRFIFLLFALITISAIAEGIFLNDGRVVYGKIIGQDSGSMQIRTGYGIITLKKNEVKKIDYDLGLGTVTVIMKNGTPIDGTLISITAAKVIVRKDTIDHDIPRQEIENLVLQKFEGRRDNIFGITGGYIKTTSSVKEQTPNGSFDVSAFYLRSSSSFPWFQWGVSAAYIKLKTINSKTKLSNATMTLNPMLVDIQMKYPLLSIVSDSEAAGKIDFFIGTGAGISYVTLTEGNDSRTDSYFTVQPVIGLSISLNEQLYLVNRYSYLYIYQKDLSYSGIRTCLGAGYIF